MATERARWPRVLNLFREMLTEQAIFPEAWQRKLCKMLSRQKLTKIACHEAATLVVWKWGMPKRNHGGSLVVALVFQITNLSGGGWKLKALNHPEQVLCIKLTSNQQLIGSSVWWFNLIENNKVDLNRHGFSADFTSLLEIGLAISKF